MLISALLALSQLLTQHKSLLFLLDIFINADFICACKKIKTAQTFNNVFSHYAFAIKKQYSIKYKLSCVNFIEYE